MRLAFGIVGRHESPSDGYGISYKSRTPKTEDHS